jgi:hypothetical protein
VKNAEKRPGEGEEEKDSECSTSMSLCMVVAEVYIATGMISGRCKI